MMKWTKSCRPTFDEYDVGHFWTDGEYLVDNQTDEKNLVGTFDEYGADGQGEEGRVSDNKAADISHLS